MPDQPYAARLRAVASASRSGPSRGKVLISADQAEALADALEAGRDFLDAYAPRIEDGRDYTNAEIDDRGARFDAKLAALDRRAGREEQG